MIKRTIWVLLAACLLVSCSVLPGVGQRVLIVTATSPASEALDPNVVATRVADMQSTVQAESADQNGVAAPNAAEQSCPTNPAVPTCPPAATVLVTVVVTATPVPPTTEAGSKSPAEATGTPAKNTHTYEVQANSPAYTQNFAHPDLECKWLGVAGQVFSKTGEPVTNLVVVAEGFLNDKALDQVALTGLSTAYGPAGYELTLSDTAVASTNSVFVSLYDLAGNELSYPVKLDTFTDCSKNLVLVNFMEK